MKDFMQGFVKGAKETPKGFFAPLFAVWALFLETTEAALAKTTKKPHAQQPSHQ